MEEHMGVAVEVYFDSASEQQVRQLQTRLTSQGIPPILEQLGFRPHVSLAGFAGIPPEPVIPLVRAFAQSIQPFPITFSHLGVFPTAEGVVFLAPTLTQHLSRLHQSFHQQLAQVALVADRYYQPDQWVPHCTIATDLAPRQMATAIQLLVQEFRPLQVQCTAIGVITFRPALPQAQFALEG
jgi:2'-5' RNA ligase